MKRIRRWRYYCDYCGKAGGSGGHMEEHEKHCTSNPNRRCRMCDLVGEVQKTIGELSFALAKDIKAGNGHNFNLPITNLYDEANGCPACILTAIKNHRKNDIMGLDISWDFSFTDASKAFFAVYNESKQQEEYDATFGSIW